MKNYLNKAIFYKEWKCYAPLMLMLTCVFGDSYNFLVNVQSKTFSNSNIIVLKRFVSNEYVIFATILVIAALIIGEDKKHNLYERLISMPFKRADIIRTKWIAGIIIIFVATIFNFMILSLLYFNDRAKLINHFNYMEIVQWFVINFLTYSVILTFFMLIQCLTFSKIIGGIIGISLISIPNILITFLTSAPVRTVSKGIVSYQTNSYLQNLSHILSYIDLLGYSKWKVGAESTISRSVILIILLITFYMILKYFFINMNFEDGKFNIPSKIGKVIQIITSLFIGVIFSQILLSTSLFFTGIPTKIPLAITLIFAIIAYFSYSKISKIINLNNGNRGD